MTTVMVIRFWTACSEYDNIVTFIAAGFSICGFVSIIFLSTYL